jgi:4-carboxymuconolactone decarboxylase
MPRIPLKTGKSDVPAAYHHVVDGVMEVFGAVRGPFGVLLHSPAMAELLLPLVPFVREKSIVPDVLRMAGVLATVRERQAKYVWGAQVGYARCVDVPEGLIDVIRSKGDTAGLPEDQRDVIEYARQLAHTNRVDQALFDRLNNKFGAQWMVEMTASMNFYAFLCGMTNAFDVPVTEGLDILPE